MGISPTHHSWIDSSSRVADFIGGSHLIGLQNWWILHEVFGWKWNGWYPIWCASWILLATCLIAWKTKFHFHSQLHHGHLDRKSVETMSPPPVSCRNLSSLKCCGEFWSSHCLIQNGYNKLRSTRWGFGFLSTNLLCFQFDGFAIFLFPET